MSIDLERKRQQKMELTADSEIKVTGYVGF